MPRKRGRKSRSAWGSNDDAGAGRRRLRFYADLHDGRGYTRHSKTIVGTKTDGDEELARLRVQHSHDAPVPTVGEMWERFELPHLKDGVRDGNVAKRTLINYESKWRNYVGPRFADVPCTDVRPIDIQGWLLGMSEASGKICRAVLKVTLDYAVMYDVMQANPADRKFRYGEDTSRERGTYSPDELLRVWDVVRGSVCEAPFLISAYGGARVGEACGLALDHMAFDGDVALVLISDQLTQDDDVGAQLKTREKSKRWTGIGGPQAARLREIVGGLPDGALYLNDRGDGTPVPRWRVRDTWDRLLEGSDVRRLPMKELRPSFETHMHWDRGVPMEKLAKIMGHTKPTTTFRYYDRPDDSQLSQLARDIAGNSGPLGQIGTS